MKQSKQNEIEIWKDVVGYEGSYQVSNIGRVKSLERIVNGRWGLEHRKSIILKLALSNFGYYTVGLHYNGVSRTTKVHRLILESFIINYENKIDVNHKNGIKTDNRLENIEWATRSENIIHAFRTGLKFGKKGEDSPTSKLTNIDVLKIRNEYKLLTQKEIGKIYGISNQTVSKIINRKRWKHI